MTAETFNVPLIIRGRIIEGSELEFGGRGGGARFATPDVRRHLGELALRTPSALADLYRLSFGELVDFLVELGGRLALERNPHLQAAFELSRRTSGLTDELLRNVYRSLPRLLERRYLEAMIERTVGVRSLEGWVEQQLQNGARVAVRAEHDHTRSERSLRRGARRARRTEGPRQADRQPTPAHGPQC